jgi:hypothetical protein
MTNFIPIFDGVQTGIAAESYTTKVLSYSPIAYWILGEESGTNAACQVNSAQDGTYTGVNLGSCLSPDGINFAPYFDGANDYVNVYSATLNAVFDGQSGSLAIWCKMADASVWTDGSFRRSCVLRADDNNRVILKKQDVANQIGYNYIAGGVNTNNAANIGSPVSWHHTVLTWDQSADEVIWYVNGIQQGAIVGGLGVFVGNLAATTTVIGADSTVPALVWHGWLSHCAIWDRPLTAAEVLDLSHVRMRDYRHKVAFYLNPFAYWPLADRTGATARDVQNHAQNGAYTGVTLADSVGPDGEPVPFFDGANDRGDVQTATFQSNLDGDEGTIAAKAKVNDVGVWTDAATRQIFRTVDTTDFNEAVQLYRSNVNNALILAYLSGGVTNQRLIGGLSNVDWMDTAITWDKPNDEVKAYLDGVQQGVTLNGLGVWAGTVDISNIGAANNAPAQVWHGWLGDVSIFNRPVPLAGVKVLSSTDIDYKQLVLAHEPIAYWPLDEVSGAVANCEVDSNQDGTYTGVTLGQNVVDDNGVSFIAPYFDGANDFANVWTATLNTVFNGAEGSFSVWVRMGNAGTWSDGLSRAVWHFRVNGNNYIQIVKGVAAGNMYVGRNSGGVWDSVGAAGLSSTDWMHIVTTWSETDDELKLYIDNTLIGTAVTLGAWAGGAMITSCIGAADIVPSWVSNAWISHSMLFDRALTAAEVARLYDIEY